MKQKDWEERSHATQFAREILQKKREIFQRHGGILNPTQLARELGYGDTRDAERWAAEHDIPPVRMGPRKRGYEVDLLAKAIVTARGIC